MFMSDKLVKLPESVNSTPTGSCLKGGRAVVSGSGSERSFRLEIELRLACWRVCRLPSVAC
jgi:hypothetical protein